MSSDFVRYSPEIETIDPDLDEYMYDVQVADGSIRIRA